MHRDVVSLNRDVDSLELVDDSMNRDVDSLELVDDILNRAVDILFRVVDSLNRVGVSLHLAVSTFQKTMKSLISVLLFRSILCVLFGNKVSANVLQLGEVADFEALTFNLALNFI